jgi:hypothetical protein
MTCGGHSIDRMKSPAVAGPLFVGDGAAVAGSVVASRRSAMKLGRSVQLRLDAPGALQHGGHHTEVLCKHVSRVTIEVGHLYLNDHSGHARHGKFIVSMPCREYRDSTTTLAAWQQPLQSGPRSSVSIGV